MGSLAVAIGFAFFAYGLAGLVDIIKPNVRFWEKVNIVFPIIVGLYIMAICAAYQARMVP